MDEIAKIIGNNIEKVKKEKGLSNDDIGQIIGVSRVTVAKYLSGDQVIDSARLFRFARAFNMSIKSFLSKNEDALSFMFRADNPEQNFPQKLANKLNATLNHHYQILKMSGEAEVSFLPPEYRLNLNGTKLTKENLLTIKEIAEKQRKNFGIEEGFNHDIYSVLEKNNINVIALPFENRDIYALSAYSETKGAFIVVNDDMNIPEERKIFSAVHELAHLIFHRDDYSKDAGDLAYKSSRSNINEKVANQFAGFFLINREHLLQHKRLFKGFVNGFSDIMRLKRVFGVSAKALILALKDENIITAANYGVLLKRLKQDGYEYVEPQPLAHIEKNQKIIELLKILVMEENITTNKVAEVLSINVKEARLLMKAWATEYGHGHREDFET